MEILIRIPPWVVDMWDLMEAKVQSTSLVIGNSYDSLRDFLQHQQNIFWIVASLIVFWPVWVYLAVALSTASAWIVWLLASILIGILQVIYVSYQFMMISINVMVLSLLKTYQTFMRSRFINYIFFFSKGIRTSHQRKSRRREWSKACESVTSYDDFLKIKVLEPKNSIPEGVIPMSPGADDSPSKLPIRRKSFATLGTLSEESDSGSPEKDSSRRLSMSLRRLASFDAKKDESIEDSIGDIAQEQMKKELGSMTYDLLTSTISRLREARHAFMADGDSSLQYLLSGVVKRNHLTIEDSLVSNARSVSVSGQHEFSPPSRKLISSYYEEVEKGLECMSTGPTSQESPLFELGERMNLVRKMKQNMGRTALMLSGGGAIAMYHLGTIRALIDAGVYDDVKVISGTSGGSISAACCAMMTSKELFEDICVPTISTDYRLNGEMKRKNIRWFPPGRDMVAYWLKHGLLVDSKYFRRTCDFYYGDTTFAEAFAHTGKHVCITVSASRAGSGTVQRLLLNHISTPHVTLASAVAASCALPGVMKPAKLETKNSAGQLEPFEVDGVEWIDGSVQADLPFERISTLFNVSNYIVAQTNFHIYPFLNKAHHPSKRSLYWRMFQTMEWDIRNRALKLSRLGLFPKLFGQDISKVFKQKYHGNLTLVPKFTTAQIFGLKALVNPSVKEMEGYLKFGQIAAWPNIGAIKDMIRLEKALDKCLTSLKDRCHELHPEVEVSGDDDLESIASSARDSLSVSLSVADTSTRIAHFGTSHSREVDTLRKKLVKVENENFSLREQVRFLQSQLAEHVGDANVASASSNTTSEEKKNDEDPSRRFKLSEGGVWNLVNQLGSPERSKAHFLAGGESEE